MTIAAKVIADSISPAGIRLVTMELRYPRFIHAELMTHRVFSRNASSSRAIPVERLIADIERDPAMPVHWGRNRPGMQAREELDPETRAKARVHWEFAMAEAIEQARHLHALGAHKQIVNRVLEPFSHINVLVTSVHWANFFALRRHEDAQPEIKALADAMFRAMEASEPVRLVFGQWHAPYVALNFKHGAFNGYSAMFDKGECYIDTDTALKVSTARAARVSYRTHEGAYPSLDKDLALFEQLVGAQPLHASPAEHQATPDWMIGGSWARAELHGNLTGWRQHRKFLPNENMDIAA